MSITRENYVAGLRAAADFYEQHENITLPSTHSADVSNFQLSSKEEAVTVAKALGACRKSYFSSLFTIKKEVAPNFFLSFVFSRSEVCERVVIGKRVIPAHVEPEKEVPEEVIEEVEWHCAPLLAATDPATEVTQ